MITIHKSAAVGVSMMLPEAQQLLNTAYKGGTVQFLGGRRAGRTAYAEYLRNAFDRSEKFKRQVARAKAAQIGMTRLQLAAMGIDDPLFACSLEHQQGRYRAFRRADGFLLHSHECRIEVIRRAERDGYHFTLA